MATPRVVFVLSSFPCYDEAFLLREIHAVAQRVETWVFSLRRSDQPVLHDAARELLPRTLSVPFFLSVRILGAHLSLLLQRPRRYFGALARLVAGNWRSPLFLAKNLVFFPKAVWLANWALRNGVTHIHAGWATYPASAALVAAAIAEVPFSFSGHAHDIYLDTSSLADKLRHAAFVTTCTAANQRYLRNFLPDGPENRVTLVHHGLRLGAYSSAPRVPQPLEVLSVGTLNPHKGFEYLIEGLRQLKGVVEFRCLIVGGGPLEASLRQRVTRAGLDEWISLTGALAQSDLLPHYARSSVFVLMAQPEWHWGIPNVIVEALAARNAVITTRFGSVEELVKDGETGLLVPAKDPAALALAIRRLADDEGLRTRLAEAGHAAVARDYDLDQGVEFYVRRFQGLPG